MYEHVYLLLCCQREFENYQSAKMEIKIDEKHPNYQLSVEQKWCLGPDNCL